MDYVNELYCICTIIITYDIRKTVDIPYMHTYFLMNVGVLTNIGILAQ